MVSGNFVKDLVAYLSSQEASSKRRVRDDSDAQLSAGRQDTVFSDVGSPRGELDLTGRNRRDSVRFSDLFRSSFRNACDDISRPLPVDEQTYPST